jgi:hypothetical protein
MKLKVGFYAFLLLLFSTVMVHAQTLPCAGTDDDSTCPLDSWVIVLVIAALFFAFFNLYRRHGASLPHTPCP